MNVENGIQQLENALTAIKDIHYKMEAVSLTNHLQSLHQIFYAKPGKIKFANNAPKELILILIVSASLLMTNVKLGTFKMDSA